MHISIFKFRMQFTQAKNVEKSPYHDQEFSGYPQKGDNEKELLGRVAQKISFWEGPFSSLGKLVTLFILLQIKTKISIKDHNKSDQLACLQDCKLTQFILPMPVLSSVIKSCA